MLLFAFFAIKNLECINTSNMKRDDFDYATETFGGAFRNLSI